MHLPLISALVFLFCFFLPLRHCPLNDFELVVLDQLPRALNNKKNQTNNKKKPTQTTATKKNPPHSQEIKDTVIPFSFSFHSQLSLRLSSITNSQCLL